MKRETIEKIGLILVTISMLVGMLSTLILNKKTKMDFFEKRYSLIDAHFMRGK